MPENPFIFKIQRYSIHDGPGIRTTIFFRGCPLSCQWCHNPESQVMPNKMNPESFEDIVASLMNEIEKDLIFYDESNGGVTFSGGEPLCQPDLLFALEDQCHEKQIHTCLDTCGFASFEVLEQAAQKTDLILYDVKLADENTHKKYTGEYAAPILNNLKQLSKLNANVKLRFPLIPDITDTDENIDGIIVFLIKNTFYRDINILPYHHTGEGKYEKLNKKYYLKYTRPSSENKIAEVKQIFESSGFMVNIGG
ncbi:MAG: glycyl-radical enzyme activating protein [Thermodesulfobacteriota bacterium]|nr:glycyl-radical enzyme activating protein [Thermodesulfobacteriota bacterium]